MTQKNRPHVFHPHVFHKSFFLTLICVVVYYGISMLLVEAVKSIVGNELISQFENDSGLSILTRIYIRNLVIMVALGVLYGVFNSISNSGQRAPKMPFDIWGLLIWILPGGFLALWHIVWVWIGFENKIRPVYLIGEHNILMPPFLAIMLSIVGYIIATSFFRRETQRRRILRSVVCTAIIMTAYMLFQSFVGFPIIRYTIMEFFAVFVFCGGIGAFFGFMYCLLDEKQKPGSWAVDWIKMASWGIFSLGVLVYTVADYLYSPSGRIGELSMILMFIFGNTITTSFYKKIANGADANL